MEDFYAKMKKIPYFCTFLRQNYKNTDINMEILILLLKKMMFCIFYVQN